MNNFDYKQIFYYAPPVIILLVIFGYYWSFGDLPTMRNISNKEVIIKTESEAAEDAFNRNDFVEVNKILDDKLSRNKGDLTSLILKANTLAQEASLTFKEKELGDQALLYINKALQIDPKNTAALTIKGYIYEIQGDYKNAHKYYDEAIKIDPKYYPALSQKAHTYDLTGDLNLAEQFYIKSLKIEPNFVKSNSGIARIYLLTGRQKEAVQYLNYVISLSSNSREIAEAQYSLGTISQTKVFSKNSTEYFQNAIDTDPSFALAYVGLSKQKFLNNQPKESLDLLIKALSIDPNLTSAGVELASQLFATGNKEQARSIIEKVKENISKDITLNSESKKIMEIAVENLIQIINNN